MLSDFSFKTFYSTASDNIPVKFYNIALSESIAYDRVSGYFSSKALAYYAKGLENLLKNKGKCRLIISHEISVEDYTNILEGYGNRMTRLEEELSNEIDWELLSDEQKLNLSNLAYLIEIGLVDLKIGFTHNGLFHAKFGLFRDNFENIVYFSGSLNETESAFTKNYEEITVLNNWSSSLDELSEKATYFDKLWYGQIDDGRIFVKSVSDAIKSKLISYSQGRIYMDKTIFEENAVVLYYDDGLQIRNNLKDGLDKTQRTIKKLIKNRYCNENITTFKSDLSYVEIEEIVKLFKRYAERTSERLIVSETVLNFIQASKFEIEEIAKRGLAIKHQDKMFNNSFTLFKDILSDEVSRPLYDIQNWVSFYQASMKRVANFSVPGAGKTSMVYGTFAYLSSRAVDKIDRLVVIGPKNSFLSWKEEYKNVFGTKRNLAVLDVHDENFREEMFYKDVDSYQLFLVNYESLEKYQLALKKVITPKTMLVFDEVHKIKRVESRRAEVAINLAKKTQYRYVLTGTPIPNSYQDIWNFLHILFDAEFNKYFDINLSQLNNLTPLEMETINEKLSPFFWRVTKNQLNVPKENDDNIIISEATNSEQQVIDLLWRKFGHNPFKLYIRLIQLSSNPQLLKNKISFEMYGDYGIDEDSNSIFEVTDDIPNYSQSEIDLIDSLSESSKLLSCLKFAENLINQSKVIIIWCIFIATINCVANSLKNKGFKVAVIHGGIESKVREKIILDFQKGYYDVLVTNPHTLAESVSLHMIAHDALYLEYSFNLTHSLQSRDRIHRLGLGNGEETNYYYFMLEGQSGKRTTIDRKIYTRLSEKRDIMYEVIESPLIQCEYSVDEKNEILKMMMEEI